MLIMMSNPPAVPHFPNPSNINYSEYYRAMWEKMFDLPPAATQVSNDINSLCLLQLDAVISKIINKIDCSYSIVLQSR